MKSSPSFHAAVFPPWGEKHAQTNRSREPKQGFGRSAINERPGFLCIHIEQAQPRRQAISKTVLGPLRGTLQKWSHHPGAEKILLWRPGERPQKIFQETVRCLRAPNETALRALTPFFLCQKRSNPKIFCRCNQETAEPIWRN